MIPVEVTLKNIKKLSPEKYTMVATWIADTLADEEASEEVVMNSADTFFEKYSSAFEALAK